MYVLPEHRNCVIQILTKLGFSDYFDEAPYDREWIYRGICDGMIVDIIWSMANKRTDVDLEWITNGEEIDCDGQPVRIIALEEMIWSKLYVLQRDRCDWPDYSI